MGDGFNYRQDISINNSSKNKNDSAKLIHIEHGRKIFYLNIDKI